MATLRSVRVGAVLLAVGCGVSAGTRSRCLELTIDRADPVEAEIADTGPEDGWRWYAIVVSAPDPRGFPHVAAVAYDADGAVIAEGESPS